MTQTVTEIANEFFALQANSQGIPVDEWSSFWNRVNTNSTEMTEFQGVLTSKVQVIIDNLANYNDTDLMTYISDAGILSSYQTNLEAIRTDFKAIIVSYKEGLANIWIDNTAFTAIILYNLLHLSDFGFGCTTQDLQTQLDNFQSAVSVYTTE